MGGTDSGSGGRNGTIRRLVAFGTTMVVICLAACQEGASRPVEPSGSNGQGPKLVPASDLLGDRSTPDRAVQSWWAFLDRGDSLTAVDSTDHSFRQNEEFAKARRSLLGGTALQKSDEVAVPYRYVREIVEVDSETNTRAVVITKIRNITPIPPAATPDEYDIKNRREGETVRYLLEKDSTGWRITQAQTHSAYLNKWYDRWSATPQVPSSVTSY